MVISAVFDKVRRGVVHLFLKGDQRTSRLPDQSFRAFHTNSNSFQ